MKNKMLIWVLGLVLLINVVSAIDLYNLDYWSFDIDGRADAGLNNFTIQGAMLQPASQCDSGSCYQCTGTDSHYLNTTTRGLRLDDTNFSIVVRAYVNYTGLKDWIDIHGSQSAGKSLMIGTSVNTKMDFSIYGGITPPVLDYIQYRLVWRTLGYVYNTSDKTVRMYVDGKLVTTKSMTTGHLTGVDEIGIIYLCGRVWNSDRYWTGLLDELMIFSDRMLTASEMLYFNDSGNFPLVVDSPPAVGGSLNLSVPFPANDTQWNFTEINLNLTANTSNYFNCSVIINGVVSGTENNIANGTDVLVDFDINFTDGEYNFWFNCTDGISNVSSVNNTIWIDTTSPVVVSNFVNGSVFFINNMTGQFNLSDNLMLFSFNITVDDVEIDSKLDLNNSFYSYNLSYNVSSLTGGLHTLGVEVYDGHTAKEEKEDYKVRNGWFNDYMKYTFRDGYVRTEAKDRSWFDSWSSVRKKDRYVQIFKPFRPSSTQVFVEKSDLPIHIVNKDGYYNDYWIVIGKKWKDYVLVDEPDAEVSIKRINDFEVEVTISGIKNNLDRLEFESIGALNTITVYHNFYRVNATVTAIYQNVIFEGSLVTHTLEINASNVSLVDPMAYLVWNGSNYGSGSETLITNDSLRFVNTFTAPTLSLSVINWTWFYNFSTVDEFNISGNQTYINMDISNCTSGNVVLNYTIYDEENKTVATSGSIELDMTLTSTLDSGMSWNFSWIYNTSVANSELLICLPDSFLNDSNFTLDSIVQYSYGNHEVEYHYIQNFNLTLANIPVYVHLYDLLTPDSTSFLIFYQDENYLYVEGAIVDVLRYYVGDGQFLSVEHGRTDEGGQTLAHLVAEDIIYKFNVWIDGVLDYSSPEYLALCQEVPCQINLRKKIDSNVSLLTLDDLYYSISSDAYVKANREVVFEFSTTDGTSTGINLTVSNALGNETICNNFLLASAGTVNCSIPISYTNDTYIIRVYREGSWNLIGYRTYSLGLTPTEIFGEDGLFLTFLMFLTLGLAGLSSGVVCLVLGIVSLIAMGMMNLIYIGNVFGLGSTIIWLIVAAGIIIWKITQRRIQ